jgi:DNA-binding NarL/FixJ family response regulator
MEQNNSSGSSIIRVLVAADSLIVRAGLEALITTSPVLRVVGSANLETLTQQVEQLQPDVVLLEWEDTEESALPLLPGSSSDQALVTHPAIVVLLDDWQQAAIADLLRSGILGILPAEATTGEILGAIQAAAIGLVVLHPDLADTLLPASVTPRPLPDASQQALTSREVEVLQMLAEGLGNKAIARRLSISEHTVKFHIGSIFSKLHASSRTEAVILGARQGLILL